MGLHTTAQALSCHLCLPDACTREAWIQLPWHLFCMEKPRVFHLRTEFCILIEKVLRSDVGVNSVATLKAAARPRLVDITTPFRRFNQPKYTPTNKLNLQSCIFFLEIFYFRALRRQPARHCQSSVRACGLCLRGRPGGRPADL